MNLPRDRMDDVDKAILNRIQSEFPISKRPFEIIAKELNQTEEMVITRINRLKKMGIIRRIGGNFSPEKMGYVSTLCAAKVAEDKIDAFAEVVNRYPGVTHNYLRANPYNIWFTFISLSMEEIEQNLKQISAETGVNDIINLPATHVYKIKAQFDL